MVSLFIVAFAFVALMGAFVNFIIKKFGQVPLAASGLGEPWQKAPLGDTVVIIGGSLAGLMSAGSLAPLYKKVIILERHENPGLETDPSKASSVAPHADQAHVIQTRGFDVLEKLFPGGVLEQELLAAGMSAFEPRQQLHMDSIGGVRPSIACDPANAQDSLLGRHRIVEAVLRKRAIAIPNVEVRWDTKVTGLVNEGNVIKGVTYTSNKGSSNEEKLMGDLIVDCGGQTTQSPLWLKKMGFLVETYEIYVRLHYITGEVKLRQISGTPSNKIFHYYMSILPERPFGALLLDYNEVDAEGNKTYCVCVQGTAGYKFDEPGGWEQLETHFRSTLPVFKDLEYVETVLPFQEYKKRGSRWNYFETAGVKNFIAVGDSTAAFNPIFGQGISTSAESVVILSNMLRSKGLTPTFAQDFQKKLSNVLTLPWLLSTMNDLQYAESKHGALARFLSSIGGFVVRKLLIATAKDHWLLDKFYDSMAMREGYVWDVINPLFPLRIFFPQSYESKKAA